MDRFKSLVSRDKDEPLRTGSSRLSARMTGQGSHFPQGKFAPDTSQASNSGLVSGTDARQGLHQSFNSPTTSDNNGSIALGQTSTYSSFSLRKGDPVGSVVDHNSQDPTTYKMPEHSFGGASSGVPPGSAGTAASLAFSQHGDPSTSNIPGAYPKDDPSIDPTQQTTSSASTTAALPTGDAQKQNQSDSLEQSMPTTHDQTTLSTQEDTGVSSETPALPPSQTSSALGKIMGAVGLGGAATAAGVAAARSKDAGVSAASTAADDQPTTTTGTDSYTAPTRTSPPLAEHRKESIPTTAYPAGTESPAPVTAPVGGTRDAIDAQNDSNSSRGTTLTAVGLGAAAGASGAATLGACGNRTSLPVTGEASEPAIFETASPTHELSSDEKSGDATSYIIGSQGEVQNRPLEASGSRVQTQPPAPVAGSPYQDSSKGQGEFNDSPALPGTALSTSGPTSQPASTVQAGTSEWGPDPRTISDEPEDSKSSGHGKAAAAGIAGAGAGAAGLAALQHGRASGADQQSGTWPSSQEYVQRDRPITSTGSATSKSTQADNATGGATPSDEAGASTRDEGQARRNAALMGVAGAGAGAGAYTAHKYKQHGTVQESATGTTDNALRRSSPEAATAGSLPPQDTPAMGKFSTAGSNQSPVNDGGSTIKDSTTTTATGTAVSGTRTSQTQDYGQRNQRTDDTAPKSKPETAPAVTKDTKKPKIEKEDPVNDENKKAGPIDDDHDEGHAGRKTAAAAAVAGGGAHAAHAAHASSDQQAEEEAAARRKHDLEEQEAARQKQYEKDQKTAEKLAAKEAKQHEKDAKKAEKQHQKELEKEEKEHQKEGGLEQKDATGYDKVGETERLVADDRRGKEAALVGVGGAAAGTAAAHGPHEDDPTHDEQHGNRLQKSQPREKKPNIFKRIFKSRKNKDTGEEEQYSTDEEDNGASNTEAESRTAGDITHSSNMEGTPSQDHSYEAASGGVQKPSYNPLHKDEPSSAQRGDGDVGTGSTGPFTKIQDPEHARGLGTSSGGPGNDNEIKTTEYDGQDRRRSYDEGAGGESTEHGDGQRKESLGHRILEQLKPLPTGQQRREMGEA
ncbi:hypothetical protein PV10_03658 [Exophiala mesophila]|uniref:Uncharacterized protein n=1 Tax=Exophiala mesophila TaxID=212818 RepID=A0A0D2AAZ2_EXOME|nr:uncharacterized protein PV10_03658 [Exophiala mesophila]KIV96078.1 hypothetical protein PV10_03658 [Exophiala mesophila]